MYRIQPIHRGDACAGNSPHSPPTPDTRVYFFPLNTRTVHCRHSARLFTLALTTPNIHHLDIHQSKNAMPIRNLHPRPPHRPRPRHVAPSNSAFSALINILGSHTLNPSGSYTFLSECLANYMKEKIHNANFFSCTCLSTSRIDRLVGTVFLYLPPN